MWERLDRSGEFDTSNDPNTSELERSDVELARDSEFDDVDELETLVEIVDVQAAPVPEARIRDEDEAFDDDSVLPESVSLLDADSMEVEHIDLADESIVEASELEEATRLEAERLEAERVEAERVEAERVEAERVEAERVEAERVEAERLEAERLEAERLEAERLEAERLEAERAQVASDDVFDSVQQTIQEAGPDIDLGAETSAGSIEHTGDTLDSTDVHDLSISPGGRPVPGEAFDLEFDSSREIMSTDTLVNTTLTAAISADLSVADGRESTGDDFVTDLAVRETDAWPVQSLSQPAGLFRRVFSRLMRLVKSLPRRIFNRRRK